MRKCAERIPIFWKKGYNIIKECLYLEKLILSNMAIAGIGVNRTSSFIGASTVVSMLAGVLILQENLTAWQIAEVAIIVGDKKIENAKADGGATASYFYGPLKPQ